MSSNLICSAKGLAQAGPFEVLAPVHISTPCPQFDAPSKWVQRSAKPSIQGSLCCKKHRTGVFPLSDPIDVPPEAFAPKPIFPDFPSKEIVEEVRTWVKTEAPWAWRGHTHAPPETDQSKEIRYVADFQLPKGIESPCPCCTPRHPKFGKGFIAWFSRSSCIRLMGQDCFKKLNPEGHQFAVDEFAQRKERAAQLAFLVANLPNRAAIAEAIAATMPIAEHLDELKDRLGDRLRRSWGIDLWQHFRDGGRLRVANDVGTFDDYGAVEGYSLVDPGRKDFSPTLSTALRGLESIDLPDDVSSADDEQLKKASRAFGRSVNLARETINAMTDAKKFVSVLNTATIRTWALLPNAPVRLDVRRENDEVYIGPSEHNRTRIPLDSRIDNALPVLPDVVTPDPE